MTEFAGVDSGVLSRQFRQRPWLLVVVDLLPVVWISLLTVYGTLNTALGLSTGTVVLVWLVALAVSVPLAVRRRRPIPVLGVVLASAIVAVLLGLSVTAPVLAVAVALYPVALSVGQRRSAIALGAALLGVTLAAVLTATVLHPHFLAVAQNAESFNTDLLSSLSFSWFAIGAGWTLGRSVRARRANADQIAEHRAQKAVSEERLRIAREMHDVVAHSMSVIVM
ncbi:MAG: histidine kinase dimerization/phosphoacceptor domain-containing protein, partial [Pseudonocardiaceae bacterium]